MAEEEIGLRLSLKERRETVAGLRDVRGEVDSTGRAASLASRGFGALGRASRAAFRGMAVGAAAAGYGAYKLLDSSVSKASDLNESLNAVNVTYGKQAKAVKRLGREAATSLGLSNAEFNSLSVQFSSFASNIAGGNGRKTVRTLDALTTRAADFASVMNLEVADAAGVFQSGLAGETEPLKKYGIDLSAAAVGAYAVAEGISASATEMTEAEKVQARYGLLMQQTEKTQGDFANTSDALANQQRILGARWDNAQAKLGKGLLPVMGKAVGYLNREGIPAFNRFSRWFNREGIPAVTAFAEDALPKVRQTVSDVRDVLEPAAGFARDMVDAFTDMPSWARKAIIGGSLAAAVGGKLGVGKLLGSRGGGGLLGLASKAKPLPVFVVNNGIGMGGPGGKPGGGKVPPVVHAAKPAGLLSRIAPLAKGLGLGALGLAAGVTYGSKDATFGPSGTAMSLDDFRYGSRAARLEAEAMSEAFEQLPSDLKTRIVLEGVPESKAAARDLANTYGLTKEERRTLFKALGIPTAKTDVSGLLGLLYDVDKPRTAEVDANTDAAEAKVAALRSSIFSLVYGTPTGLGAPSSGGTTPRAPKPPRAPRSPAERSAAPAPAARRDLHVTVEVDRQVLGRTTVRSIEDAGARQ